MVATVIPQIRKRFAKSLATFWVVVGLLATGGGFALTSTTAVSAQQPTASWTHLGGDPLFPGGLSAIAAQQHFSLRDAYVFALTSPVGQSALATDGLSVAQREAVTAGARQGEFVSCSLIYGDVFQAMTYGANGVAVDHYVIFSDPRFKNHGSPAFCENIRVGNVVVHLLVPVVCANIALINMTPAPTPLVPVTITKVAESATGQVFPTPTGTFRFQVTAGGSEHVVLYQQANQLLGKYPVGSTVRVQELSTLGNGKWVTLSPDVQTVRLTKQPFLFVYKDQEAATPPTPLGSSYNHQGRRIGYRSGLPPTPTRYVQVPSDRRWERARRTLSAGKPAAGQVPGRFDRSSARALNFGLGNGKWVTLSPDVQTVRLTKQPFLFVYKDQEAATPPTPLVPVTITKVAESATGQVFPTPTGTFRFQVTAGGSEHVVLYQQANQLLGKYPVGSTVRVQEL